MFSSHTNGGDSRHDLPQLQLVEDGGFTSSVQPHHQNPHLLFAYQALQQVPKDVSHVDGRPLDSTATELLNAKWLRQTLKHVYKVKKRAQAVLKNNLFGITTLLTLKPLERSRQ